MYKEGVHIVSSYIEGARMVFGDYITAQDGFTLFTLSYTKRPSV